MKKIIWSYWDGPTNDLLDKSLESWKKYFKDWQINILNKKTIKNYKILKPKNYNQLTPTIKSDVIRLNLLYQYGGLWLDRTIIINKPITWLKKYEKYSYFSFLYSYFSIKQKAIENWFIMVPKKNNKYIKLWLDTFIDILNTNPYENHVAYKSICMFNTKYYMMYQAYCYLLDSNKDFRKNHDSIPFKKFSPYKNSFFYFSTFIENIDKQPHELTKFIKIDRHIYNYKDIVLFIIIIVICFVLIINFYKRIQNYFKYTKFVNILVNNFIGN
jgi:hypothetical protein